MLARASYRKLDFVDYFKALTHTHDGWIEEFISDQRRLAILEAFAIGRVTLGPALDFLAREFPRQRIGWEQCLRHSARRYFLPKEDPRHINVGEEVKARYEALLSGFSPKGVGSAFWFSPGQSFSKREEAKGLWSFILREEERQYIDYWKVANWEEFGALLGNRRLLAKIDAFNRRLDAMEPHDHIVDIEPLATAQIPSLGISLRYLVLAHLSRDIQSGIVQIPTNLETEFPQIYAERGIR